MMIATGLVYHFLKRGMKIKKKLNFEIQRNLYYAVVVT